MIAYQEYNTKSPLNGLAAKWAAQNPQLLPVDPQPVAPPLAQAAAAGEIAVSPHAIDMPASIQSRPTEASPAESDPWEKKIIIS